MVAPRPVEDFRHGGGSVAPIAVTSAPAAAETITQ